MESQGKKLRRLRELAGLNQFTVARAAGIHRATLSAIENDHMQATEQQAAAIERACTDAAKKATSEMNTLAGTLRSA